MKKCKQCGETKPIWEFYKHPDMLDGHLNICKTCKRLYAHYYGRTPQGRENDKSRNHKLKRRQQVVRWGRQYRQENPQRYHANGKLNSAVEHGKILRPNLCSKCNSSGKIEGHHADYDKPLEVMWLCTACHRKEHRVILPF